MSNITHYADHVGANASKVFKATLFRSERLMLGLNCLHPGQEQHPHVHGGQDKFYFVVEGTGEFVVGDERRTAGEGMVVGWPAIRLRSGMPVRAIRQLQLSCRIPLRPVALLSGLATMVPSITRPRWQLLPRCCSIAQPYWTWSTAALPDSRLRLSAGLRNASWYAVGRYSRRRSSCCRQWLIMTL